MKIRNIIILLIVLATSLIFFSCNSPEYTSAKMYVQQNQLDKAEEYFIKALDSEPLNPEVPYKLARDVYEKQEKFELVKKYLDESLKRGDTFKDEIDNVFKFYWGNSFNEGVKYFNAVVRDEAIDRDLAIEKALNKFKLGQIFNPTDENTAVQIVRIYWDLLEDQNTAFEELDKALELIPGSAILIGIKADYLSKLDRNDEAIALLDESLAANPANLKNTFLLGALYFDASKFDEAIATYQNALTEFPEEKDIYFNLGLLYINMKDYENANAQFQQVLAFDPEDKQVIEAVGDVYMNNLEDYITAEMYYRQLNDLDPMNPYYMKKLAYSLNKQNRTEEGMRLFNEAKALE